MKSHFHLGVASAALLLSSPAFSQSETNGQGSTAPIALPGAGTQSVEASAATPGAPISNGPGEIIVTARKVAENLQTVPVAMTALNGSALAQASIRTVNDLQSVVPNLTLQASGNDPQAFLVSIRGQKQNDTPLTVDPSVGVYLDGIYIPRTYGMGNALLDLQRVEVLRGPQGTLYGRNTTGGAVSLITKDPTDEFGASVDATGGNYGTWNIVGILNAPLTDDVGLRIVAQRGKHSGYGHDATGRDLDNDDSSYVRAKLKANLGAAVQATLWGSYQKDDTNGGIYKFAGLSQGTSAAPPGGVTTLEAAAELGGLTAANIGTAISLLDSYANSDYRQTDGTTPGKSNFEGEKTGLDVKADLGSNLTLRSISGYQHFNRLSAGDEDGTPYTILAASLGTYDNYVSQELQLLGGDKKFNWVLGAYGGDERGKEFSNNYILGDLSPNNPSHFDALVRNKSAAAFAQANLELARGWRLTGGVRYSSD